MAKSEQEILQMFRSAVLEVENKDIGNVKAETDLATLGLSSVATMEVIGAMEEKLNVQFPDEDLAKMKKLSDLTGLVHRLVK